MHEHTDWLMVIDVQPAFGHPESPWFTPSLDAITDRIAALVPLFGERVIFTRFVPPETVTGSWSRYYAKWDFAHAPAASWLWALDPRFAGRASIASHRFSKWSPELHARLGPDPTVALCGVSTDCCVLATALAAVDDGAHVRLIEDACAAKSPEIHARALAIMASRAPQLTVVTLAEEQARQWRKGSP
jgi:nicotinamidase-related amidase